MSTFLHWFVVTPLDRGHFFKIMTTYSEKLKDPRWQKKRLKILNRDNFTCRHCGDKEKTLHVHHKMYFSVEPWEYEDFLLITLCKDCHDNISSLEHLNDMLLFSLCKAAPQKTKLQLLWNLCDKPKLVNQKYFNNARADKISRSIWTKSFNVLKEYFLKDE